MSTETPSSLVSRYITDADGAFSFRLPGVPGGTDDVYFVSTRYHGILYFGAAVTDAASADSVHTLEVYDTLTAAPGGHPFPVANRTLLIETKPEGWRVTDLFEIENASDRTVIAGSDEATWSYPLMVGAENVELGDSDLGPDAWAFDAGRVRAPTW